MSILHVLLNIPGGTYRHEPLFRTTTLVGYVLSKPSSALKNVTLLLPFKGNLSTNLGKTLLGLAKLCVTLTLYFEVKNR